MGPLSISTVSVLFSLILVLLAVELELVVLVSVLLVVFNTVVLSCKNLKFFKLHLDKLWIHGFVHLFGYDHKNKKDFKKFHPSGNLGAKLKTVEDIMLTKDKVPFINENSNMKIALKILTQKKLGTLIVKNTRGETTGIITDGQIRRFGQKSQNLHNLKVREVMTKNQIRVDKDILAQKALVIMNEKKITSLCVHKKRGTYKTIGLIHIHHLLDSNIG